MVRVWIGNRQGIIEDGCRFMERHPVLEKILRSLPWIPLELQIALPASFTRIPNGDAETVVDAEMGVGRAGSRNLP